MRTPATRQSLRLLAARPSPTSSRPHLVASVSACRRFSASRAAGGRNRVYQTIRSPQDLDNLLLVSTSSSVPLITMFTASWCPSCKVVLPQIQRMIENDGVGEEQGGVGFAEIEYDAPGNEELGERYMVRSLPTLLAFSRGEPQLETKVTRVDEMKDQKAMREWIETEAARAGKGGAGGGSGWLGKLFGKG